MNEWTYKIPVEAAEPLIPRRAPHKILTQEPGTVAAIRATRALWFRAPNHVRPDQRQRTMRREMKERGQWEGAAGRVPGAARRRRGRPRRPSIGVRRRRREVSGQRYSAIPSSYRRERGYGSSIDWFIVVLLREEDYHYALYFRN
jgi:hypothetical protein